MTLNAQMFCRRTRLGGCQTLWGSLQKSCATLVSAGRSSALPFAAKWGLLAHSDIELTQVPKQAIDLSEDVKRVSILNQAASLLRCLTSSPCAARRVSSSGWAAFP